MLFIGTSVTSAPQCISVVWLLRSLNTIQHEHVRRWHVPVAGAPGLSDVQRADADAEPAPSTGAQARRRRGWLLISSRPNSMGRLFTRRNGDIHYNAVPRLVFLPWDEPPFLSLFFSLLVNWHLRARMSLSTWTFAPEHACARLPGVVTRVTGCASMS
jgi:hypothetical protein